MTTWHRHAFACLAAIVLLLVVAPARATEVYMDGVGGSTCKQVLADIRKQPSETAHVLLGWSLGYMTRRNVEQGLAGKHQVNLVAMKVTADKLMGTMLAFCKEFPDAHVFEFVDAFYEVLLEESAPSS
jgi:hypothetical protein